MTSPGAYCTACGTLKVPNAERCPTCGTAYDARPRQSAYPGERWGIDPTAPVPRGTVSGRTSEYDTLRFSVALVAALVLGFAGLQMVGLRSVSGDSLAEVFYHAVGWMTWGLALLSVAVGLRRG